MGTDIHLMVEALGSDVKWHNVDEWERDEAEYQSGAIHYWPKSEYYGGRNYSLFAILADVRNGFGFGGVDTGNPVKPIAKPRGIPSDASAPVKRYIEQWADDGHSHSYLTVAEIMAFDWTQVATRRGVVNAVEFEKWDDFWRGRGDSPSSWSGGVSGANIEMITEGTMRQRISELHGKHTDRHEQLAALETMRNVYCQVEWQQPFYKLADDFLGQTLPRLWRLGKPEDVRIVFFFDN